MKLYSAWKQAEIEKFFVKMDEAPEVEVAPVANAQGQKRLEYDISGIEPGTHVFTVAADNGWEKVYDPSPFDITRPAIINPDFGLYCGRG